MNNKENLECIAEQVDSIQSAFNDLDDGFYQIGKCIKDIIKNMESEKILITKSYSQD